MKIGILTWLHNGNYGSILQAYALQKYLRNQQYEVENINYKPSALEKLKNFVESHNSPSLFLEKIDAIKSRIKNKGLKLDNAKNEKFDNFRNRYFNLTQIITKTKNLSNFSDKYDAYICGSDQIWSPMLLNPVFYFSFVKDNKKKISYACSFGMNHIPESKKNVIKKLLLGFNEISVRENEGSLIVKELIDRNASVLVDPTLLLDKKEWSELTTTSHEGEDYILCYFLSFRDEYLSIIRKLSNLYGKKIVVIPTVPDTYEIPGELALNVGPEDWVGLVKNANAILTDSFHGCVFSIIFQKHFYVIKRFNDANPKSQNSRIYTLLNKYNLMDRLVTAETDIASIENIDWNAVNNRVQEDIMDSKQWLKTAIQYSDINSKSEIPSLDKKSCVGCGSCVLACPKNCISMSQDEKGFNYPIIDEKQCIQCKKCEKNCPVLKNDCRAKVKEIYAAKTKSMDNIIRSTSGGVFTTLAERVIAGGGVVYGAAYNQNLEVEHIRIDTNDELYRIAGSKYVQSNMHNAYKSIRSELESGRKVLFSGTGCQIAAISAFLNKKYDNLITAEVVCHGVPAPGLFKSYLKWLETNEKFKVVNYRFRSKSFRPTGEHYKLEYILDNDKSRSVFANRDPYYANFLKGTILRDCCYSCKFKGEERSADFTMGDFWGVEKIVDSLDITNGVSVLMLNTQKAIDIWKEIKGNFDAIKVTYQEAIMCNSAIDEPTEAERITYNLCDKELFKKLKPDCTAKDVVKNYIPWKIKHIIKKYL